MNGGLNVILLGPLGSGKGTQGKLLEKKYGIPHLSAGDILRSEVKEKTPFGLKAKQIMDRGELVADALIIEMMNKRLSQTDCEKGYILDGYPRTIEQADALDRFLNKLQKKLFSAIFLEIPDDEIVKRLSGRLTCEQCGRSYHAAANPPMAEGFCNQWGGRLTHRADDTEGTVRSRIEVYKQKTAALVDYYEKKKLLARVASVGGIKAVFQRICSLIDEKGMADRP